MEFPPLFNNLTSNGAEQRITVRLRKYWDYLRGERNFPAEKDIKPTEIADIWDNCFIVKADNSCTIEDYQYKYLGQNIRHAYGSDLTGHKVQEIVSTEAHHLTDKYESVLALKRPVTDEGEIKLSKKEILKYRQILLPLGDDGINIQAILGGMSYKVFENERKFLLFGRGKK